jgi:hypothetical protein
VRARRPPKSPSSGPRSSIPADGSQGGRVIITREPGAPERARVIGSLTGEAVQILLDAINGGVAVLDLSEVDQVDDSAVQLLARLRPQRCTIVACPRWLTLWLATVRGRDDV